MTRTMRVYWLLVLGSTVAGLLAGIGYSLVNPGQYSSSATVAVHPISTALFPNSPLLQLVNTQTESVTMSSNQVRRLAAAELADGTEAGDLRDSVTVSTPDQSLAITVTSTADEAEAAAARANAMVAAYLKFRAATAQERIDTYLENVDATIAGLADKPNPDVLTQLQLQRAEAQSTAIDPGTVIHEATIPESSSSDLLLFGAAGAALGFLSGLALALWRMRRKDLIYSTADMAATVSGREPAFTQVLVVPGNAPQSEDWGEEARDEALSLTAAIRRSILSGGRTVAVLAVEPMSGLCRQLQAALADRPGDDPQESTGVTVIDLTGRSRGSAARDSVGADALVVAAIDGRTTKAQLVSGPAHSLQTAPQSVPIGYVLLQESSA